MIGSKEDNRDGQRAKRLLGPLQSKSCQNEGGRKVPMQAMRNRKIG
jgi:hypothetical protein